MIPGTGGDIKHTPNNEQHGASCLRNSNLGLLVLVMTHSIKRPRDCTGPSPYIPPDGYKGYRCAECERKIMRADLPKPRPALPQRSNSTQCIAWEHPCHTSTQRSLLAFLTPNQSSKVKTRNETARDCHPMECNYDHDDAALEPRIRPVKVCESSLKRQVSPTEVRTHYRFKIFQTHSNMGHSRLRMKNGGLNLVSRLRSTSEHLLCDLCC